MDGVRQLRFDDGTPVTAASAIAPLGDGWLVAQDDATSAAWRRPASTTPVRLFPPVDGLDRFSERAGTKHLKPDVEVACPAEVDGAPAVLLLGSGSTARRMRAALVVLDDDGRPVVHQAQLGPVYARVAAALQVPLDQLNLEGASRHHGTVRWFQRGNLAAGLPSASVELSLDALVAAVLGRAPVEDVDVRRPLVHELGEVEGVGLAVTDAVALPDGRLLLSAAAEDTPNAVDDGPVVATALALVDGDDVVAVVPVPEVAGRVHKLEGLGLVDVRDGVLRLLAVVDDDDPDVPSAELDLRVVLG